MNAITDLLNMENPNMYISDIKIERHQIILMVETPPTIHFVLNATLECFLVLISNFISISIQ